MKKGFTLVEIMIVVAIIALLAALAIPALLRPRMAANEAAAQATLKTLSTACETFASSNANGDYPAAMGDLTGATPPYLNIDYADGTVRQGYSVAPTLAVTGYTFVATPAACGSSGSNTFTITTGGALTSAACA
ncbi:MAG: prepilin-type N-terminal cleavage/methylation domain-containing protein [Candidatus Omnitrophica bacterium]|nr:prepilin-type N-terminal cleavage/methylation domain-containing protein [Candidatus Omnitrophota bacterium]